MEHLVQFTISMDDKKITDSVEKNAEKVIINDLKTQVSKVFFNSRYNPYSGYVSFEGPSDWTKDVLKEFLEEHKDEIIKLASEDLAGRMSRMKAVKEAAVEAVK